MESTDHIHERRADDGIPQSGVGSRSQEIRRSQVSESQLGSDKGTPGRALIDTDFYLYKAAAGATYTFKWDDDNRVGMTNLAQAKDAFRKFVDWIEDTCPDHIPIFCLGGKSNFRYGLWPNYKSNRRERTKPWGYSELIQWVMETYLVVQIDNVETDDVVGMHYKEGDVIVSGDKDMKTIPGVHLQGEGLIDVSEDEADHNFFCQALSGDTSDGYPGCKGVGTTGAGKLLAECESNEDRWQVVMQQYRKKGFDEFYAITQARLARILRRGEYDIQNDEPKLWIPPL